MTAVPDDMPPPVPFDDRPWAADALCLQVGDPESWFPERGGSTREAKKVCNNCDVRAECLDYALTNREQFGVYGGKSERERRRILNADTTGQYLSDRRPGRHRHAPSAAVTLMRGLGVTAAEVRTWAARQHIACNSHGVPPNAVVEAWADAHPQPQEHTA